MGDCDGLVQVEDDVPVAAGNEDGLARMLDQFDLFKELLNSIFNSSILRKFIQLILF